MKTLHTILFLWLIVFFTACSSLEPKLDPAISDADLWKDRDFSMGVLNDAYSQLPAFYTDEFGESLDCATDNAVTNDFSSGVLRMATGGWTASQNPLNSWKKCYVQIRNLNKFIEKHASISFSNDAQKDAATKKRVKGEAYFLRAWYEFELLSRYSGPDGKGKMLGFPIVLTTSEEGTARVSRNSFSECVERINADIDSSVLYLPATQYTGADVVVGATQTGRAYRLSALSLKSRLWLYAASPAYTVFKTDAEKKELWEKAASSASVLMTTLGSLPAITVNGAIYADPAHAEIIWRNYQPDNNAPERENFIPSRWGNGRINPSQQLVNAFPMKDGYPTGRSAAYDPAQPYNNRDNRFTLTVLYNGAAFGTSTVETFNGGKDSESSVFGRATRTGYYLRKFMDANVNIDPALTASTSKHYYAFFRRAEIWLNFAEAANEAWGPEADPLALGRTAKSALAALRVRAGIAAADPYLTEVAGQGKNAMRDLIQNERRIELSFENHRFFDVRRWLLPLAALNQQVEGVEIQKTGSSTYTYTYNKKVETRNFRDYMYYFPVPEQEIYTTDSTVTQNIGW